MPVDQVIQEVLLPRIESDLGFEAGRIRFGRGSQILGTPNLTPKEKKRLQVWATGIQTGLDQVFVLDQWVPRQNSGLFKNEDVSVRRTKDSWVAKSQKLSASGTSAQAAGQALSRLLK